jgi:hypothetical protein
VLAPVLGALGASKMCTISTHCLYFHNYCLSTTRCESPNPDVFQVLG